MKYVNLHIFFFMVHLCNIQMSAASTKHILKGMNYDIDGFVSQLFASRRFVELVDKLSEEAANRIKYNYNKKSFIVSSDIHEAPVYNEKGTKLRSKATQYDIDGFISQVLASKNIHELFAKLTVNAASKINANSEFRTRTSSNENQPTNQVNNTNMREHITEKIDIQTIINEMLSLSENLKLKYDDDDNDTNTKLQSKESETTASVNKDHISKTVGRTSKHNVAEKNKNESKKKTVDENKRLRDDAKDHYRNEDPNRYSETSHGGHSGTDGEDQQTRTAEENLSSLDEESHNRPPSEEKTNREVEETKGVTENRSTDENIEDKNDGAQGHEDSVRNNKIVSDDNPYIEVYRSKSSEDSGDRRSQEHPQERSQEDQRLKEQSDEGQVKPDIRIEGGKQYTYVQNADYDEFNEKMAKWQKTHPENATDFIT